MDDRELHFYTTPDGYDVVVTGDISDIEDDSWEYEEDNDIEKD